MIVSPLVVTISSAKAIEEIKVADNKVVNCIVCCYILVDIKGMESKLDIYIRLFKGRTVVGKAF